MAKSRYGVSSYDIKKMAGGTFKLTDRGTNRPVTFEVIKPPSGAPDVKSGAEAYGICVDGDLGSAILPAFLKVFRHEIPQRNTRNQFLVAQGLATKHWIFRGVPFGFLTRRRINGIDVHGNLSIRLRDRQGQTAPSLAQLVVQDAWTYDSDQRARFSGQLCCAVYALEALGWAHGDLSLGNVLIGWQEGDGEVAVLVDFDGFYHPLQPLLPIKEGKYQIRKSGSAGFQDPIVLDAIASDPEAGCVQSDRVALGALVCQLMVWQAWMVDDLKRHQLLTPAMTKARSLGGLPSKVLRSWPEGFDLLRRALEARRLTDQPTPREWLAAVGGPGIAPPVMVVSNRRLRPAFRKGVQLQRTSGSLGPVHRDLAKVNFRRQGDAVVLEFPWKAPVIFSARDAPNGSPAGPHLLKPGSFLTSNFWKFELKPAVDVSKPDT